MVLAQEYILSRQDLSLNNVFLFFGNSIHHILITSAFPQPLPDLPLQRFIFLHMHQCVCVHIHLHTCVQVSMYAYTWTCR